MKALLQIAFIMADSSRAPSSTRSTMGRGSMRSSAHGSVAASPKASPRPAVTTPTHRTPTTRLKNSGLKDSSELKKSTGLKKSSNTTVNSTTQATTTGEAPRRHHHTDADGHKIHKKHPSDDLEKRQQELKTKEEELITREEALARLEANLRKRAEELTLREAEVAKAHMSQKFPPRNPAGILTPLPDKAEKDGIMYNNNLIPELTEKQQTEALRAFNAIDTNQNGVIDTNEFYAGLKMLYPDMTRPECNRIYGQIDTNRDGTITFHEFLRGIIQYQWDCSLWKERERVTTSVEHYEWEIPYEELKLLDKLGEGSYGIVYKAKWRHCLIAVKELKSQKVDSKLMQAFKREIAILASLRHPNIVLYMGASTHMPHLSICTEFLPGGSVYELLHERRAKPDLHLALYLAKQTALGLQYLHSLHPKIIHRDCKSENLLLDNHFTLKLCDFGLSILEPTDGSSLTERVGSPLWMSPEMLTKQAYTEKADVYSFGVCFWEFLSGEVPFGDVTQLEVLVQMVSSGQRPKISSSWNVDISQLIEQCWSASQNTRPTMREVIPKIDKFLERTRSSK